MTVVAPAVGKRVSRALPAALVASLRAADAVRFIDGAGQAWEWSSFKTRYVRTAAGSKRYGLPIGAPIVGKGRKPTSGGGKSGGGGEGTAPKPGAKKPAAKEPAAKKQGGKVKLTPAQRDAAERHLGREPGAGRGAYLDGNELVVEDRDTAVKALDKILAGDDLTPGERKARKNLRDKIAKSEPGDKGGDDKHDDDAAPIEPAVEPTPKVPEESDPVADAGPDIGSDPEPETPPPLGHDELWADWLENGPTLDEEEGHTVGDYVDAGYQEINGILRDNVDFPLSDDLEDMYRERIKTLQGVMDRYQLPAPATLYRRVSGEHLPAAPAEPGSVFADKAFLSTSTVPNPQNFQDMPVVMEIAVPKGMNAINVYASGHGLGGEKEVLLPPGTRMRIDSDEMRDGKRWVTVTALPPE